MGASRSGARAHPLYAALTAASGSPVRWNYESFLVNRDGALVKHWPAGTQLTAPPQLGEIEAALSAPPSDFMARVMAARRSIDLEHEETALLAQGETELQRVALDAKGATYASERLSRPGAAEREEARKKEGVPPGATCGIKRIAASELLRLPAAELAETLREPHVVSGAADPLASRIRPPLALCICHAAHLMAAHCTAGLIDDWPALTHWSTSANFSARFGDNYMRLSRFPPGSSGAEEVDIVQVTEAAPSWHSVIVESAQGTSDAEHIFMDDLQRDYSVPPILQRTTGTRVLGIGGGTGVRMANHGFAWLGLAAGAKVWYLASYEHSKPREPTCNRVVLQPEIVRNTCTELQLPGEVGQRLRRTHWIAERATRSL